MHRLQNPNLEILMLAVEQLGELVNEMIFVGGCATGLLIDNKGAPPIRATYDVDAIVQIISLQEYHQFAKRLRLCGFAEDRSEAAPVCRYVSGNIVLDIMPTKKEVLGFGNEWYAPAVKHVEHYQIKKDVKIKMLSAPYFLMTKFSAFDNRGNNDYVISHDFEDIIAVVNGRNNIVREIEKSEKNVKYALVRRFAKLLEESKFIDSLPGQVPTDELSQKRVPIILNLIKEISEL